MRQRSRGAVFVTVALALVGCEDGSSGALASEALCSDPAAYEGREIWVEGALDTSEPVLWGQSAALCSEAQPCCNTADYVYALACGGRDAVPIVVVPDVTLSDSERAQLGGLSCRGLASGGIAAECRPSCDTTLAASVRALRGTLGPVVSGIEGQVRVLSVISVERSAVPDAGPLPDAAE